jgi:hypothetical protein
MHEVKCRALGCLHSSLCNQSDFGEAGGGKILQKERKEKVSQLLELNASALHLVAGCIFQRRM